LTSNLKGKNLLTTALDMGETIVEATEACWSCSVSAIDCIVGQQPWNSNTGSLYSKPPSRSEGCQPNCAAAGHLKRFIWKWCSECSSCPWSFLPFHMDHGSLCLSDIGNWGLALRSFGTWSCGLQLQTWQCKKCTRNCCRTRSVCNLVQVCVPEPSRAE
jgi:hypothetical protein